MNYFEKSKVRGGIYVLSESAPEWVRDAVREAHVGTLPNDWVYSVCKNFFDVYDPESVKDPYGFAHEFADRQVNIYTNTLAQWYADNCLTSFMAQADEELEELGLNHGHLSDQIKALQHIAIRRIAEIIIEACQNNQEENTQ